MRTASPRPVSEDDDQHGDPLVEALATRAAAGDNDALGELYERYGAATQRFIERRVSGQAAAEDVNGDLWMKVATSIRGFTSYGPGSFAGWLFTIARRLVISHYRTHGRSREQVTSDMLMLDVAVMDAAERVAGDLDDQALVAHALTKLTAEQRECVVLRFFDGLSIADTAAVMSARGRQRNANAVKQLQFRALNKLAQVMPPEARNRLSGPSVLPVAGRVSTPDAAAER